MFVYFVRTERLSIGAEQVLALAQQVFAERRRNAAPVETFVEFPIWKAAIVEEFLKDEPHFAQRCGECVQPVVWLSA